MSQKPTQVQHPHGWEVHPIEAPAPKCLHAKLGQSLEILYDFPHEQDSPPAK